MNQHEKMIALTRISERLSLMMLHLRMELTTSPPEARWSTIINTTAPQLNVALDSALHSIATSSKELKGCFVEGTFTTRNLGVNDIKKIRPVRMDFD